MTIFDLKKEGLLNKKKTYEQFLNSNFFKENRNYLRKTINKYLFYTTYKFNLYDIKMLIFSKNNCSDFIDNCM